MEWLSDPNAWIGLLTLTVLELVRAPNAEPLKELAEGVGFEPTVGFPTLDFESCALNRTQPPFLVDK